MNTNFNHTRDTTGSSADSLIKFSLFVQGRNGATYSAFVHMTLADYQKHFCKDRENEDPAAYALEDWKEVQCVVPELSGYCSQDAGNVEVSILSREQICHSSFEPYEDDDEHLWDKLTDRAGIPWQEATRFREEITANVTNFIANPPAGKKNSSTNNESSPPEPADAPILIELYASVDNPFDSDNDSAVMRLKDYQKYFCPAGVDPIDHAYEYWYDKKEYYCYADHELTATIQVFTYTAKDIRDGKYTETKSGNYETKLWDILDNHLNDDAPENWNELRKTLQQNVKDLLYSLADTAHVTCEIPKEMLPEFQKYVESIGGTWQE